jgi:hypothetical protein
MIQILSCHSFSNRQHLAGRTIWGNGKKAVASCKKMLALVKASEYKDGLPSGRNFADYIQFVREQYWKTFELPNILKKEQNGTEATAEASDAGDDGDDNEDEEDPEVLPTLDKNLDPEKVQEYMDKHMKQKWFPSGILSFALWGVQFAQTDLMRPTAAAASTSPWMSLAMAMGARTSPKMAEVACENNMPLTKHLTGLQLLSLKVGASIPISFF